MRETEKNEKKIVAHILSTLGSQQQQQQQQQ
jgi:hypothetical protein